MSSKPSVIAPGGSEPEPFLRGILVQSLLGIGLPFPDAYGVAQAVRGRLELEPGPIAKDRLRRMVAEHLEERFGGQLRGAYEAGRAHRTISVRNGQRLEPFSVGVLTRHLEGCGIRYEQASRGARLVQTQLHELGEPVIDDRALRRIVYTTLSSRCCADAASRFLSRCHLRDNRTPLILLIGGATGAGKSTVATRLAYLLDIVRTQSTDMMREIIRCYLASHVAPTLGFSSFDAWKGLPRFDGVSPAPGDGGPVVSGFLAQFGNVKVALEATIARAIKERHDLIVDGVHVLPSWLDLAPTAAKAVVIPLVLAVTTKSRLDEHLLRRSKETPDRDTERQRRTLDAIWQLQSFMVDQAEQNGIPVIANWTVDDTVWTIMDLVMAEVGRRFPPDPEVLL